MPFKNGTTNIPDKAALHVQFFQGVVFRFFLI